MRSRLLGWYYTGPVGHLVAGIADWTELLARWHWSRRHEHLERLTRRR